ncbi:NepR family anti-sigma factor [Nitratireductor sp. ZSWI3]|uniref:NepR family anti-sigma factor n=1 Tax=Nitratireductor sp. ZSWI3 TaxID=2966359 RepID=UPI00214F76B4|nr:NepR family anti-sigma factor [Nitratireductor sp. ZSWI3]MCR4267074.1 NepR family anti-sigma factor [Nitratireductor sp. ZSWI3]
MSYGKSTNRRTSGRRDGGDDLLGVNSEIGRKLKQYYEDLVTEEIPDRFAELLSQLEQSDRSEKAEQED